MSKALRERVLRIQRYRGSGKLVIGIKDTNAYQGVKVNGALMSEKQFRIYSELQGDENIEVFLVSILENKRSDAESGSQSRFLVWLRLSVAKFLIRLLSLRPCLIKVTLWILQWIWREKLVLHAIILLSSKKCQVKPVLSLASRMSLYPPAPAPKAHPFIALVAAAQEFSKMVIGKHL